jgi:DNA-binding transcriptional MerR regulator
MNALQLYQPEPGSLYTVETTARIAGVHPDKILLYLERGLLAPVDRESHFDDASIRALRRIEYLHTYRDINLTGTRIILDLLDQVERLSQELRFLRQ